MRTLKIALPVAVIAYFMTAALLYSWRSEMRTPGHIDALPTVQKTDELTLILLGDMGLPGP